MFAGILSSMGHALFRRDLWFTNYARSPWDHCWTLVLLPNRVAPTCHRKGPSENAKLDVSFSLGLLGWIGHFKGSFAALVVGEYSTAALSSVLVLAERRKGKT